MSWSEDQVFEKGWHGNCCNSLGEEMKQVRYAQLMGLMFFHNGKSPYNMDMRGKTVLDIGGGPVSLLLKCINVRGTVVDPCDYPQWVKDRYQLAGIDYHQTKAEDFFEDCVFDECWVYNVLQHVDDVAKIVSNVKKNSKLIRIFEWVDTYVSKGHPNVLSKSLLDKLLGGDGKVIDLKEPNLVGRCYCGVFKGDHYEN
jgi:hypothetical protein